MKFIGITGGVGAGKSKILHYIEQEYSAKIVLADQLAHELMLPGTSCFKEIQEIFGTEDIFTEQGSLDTAKVSEVIFSDEQKRSQMNQIVHPAVKREILRLVEEERQKEEYSYFILEAALLIEEGYDTICDELWFVDTAKLIIMEHWKRRMLKSEKYLPESWTMKKLLVMKEAVRWKKSR